MHETNPGQPYEAETDSAEVEETDGEEEEKE